ncbi:uncharacterized protein LOC132045786 [Lycium ferocissimum]|uniref:uncharacterized protein LOC132045786 n=1 Tax=Lycium ferocissimum TaxID=112874 RepID=UPI002815EC22|nr:uncharacterized protein LOC132045786 [Lycium ferocissimum]
MKKDWRAEQDKREGDMEKKMKELLEKSNRSARKATGPRYDDLCMHPNLDLPEAFKILKFEMFNGAGNPKAHLRSYCDQLVGVKKNKPLIMRLFSRSLTGEAAEWFATQDIWKWHVWEDIAESFMERFHFNVETVLDRYYLEKVKQKSTENYREFGSRWRAEAARVQPPMCEGELVSVFIKSHEPDFYDKMLFMAGRPFAELVKMGEAIEDGLKYGKIVSIFNKSSGKAATGTFRKKKEDMANISHTPNPSPKEPLSTPIATPLINYPTPVYYAQPNFTTIVPTYTAPPSVHMSAPTYQAPPQQNYRPNNPPQAYQPPQNYQNQPPPPTYNASRLAFERRPVRDFTTLLKPRARLFERLLAAGLIRKVSPKPAQPKNRFYRADLIYAYHSGGNRHITKDCINIKHKIHDLTDKREIVLQTAAFNVNTNPLPNHKNSRIHMIEKNEDWKACRALIPKVVESLEHTLASLSFQERPNGPNIGSHGNDIEIQSLDSSTRGGSGGTAGRSYKVHYCTSGHGPRHDMIRKKLHSRKVSSE